MSKLSLNDRRWRALTPLILERDGYQCVVCQSTEDLTVDHVKALDTFTAEDWDNELQYDPTNLVTACRSCNGRKGNRTRIRVTWLSPRWLTAFSGRGRTTPGLSDFPQNQSKLFETERGSLL